MIYPGEKQPAGLALLRSHGFTVLRTMPNIFSFPHMITSPFGFSGNGISFAYDEDDRLINMGTGAAAVTYDYCDDGYRTARTQGVQRNVYDYTTAGQLAGVSWQDYDTGLDAWTTDSATEINYHLDALGRRVAKAVGGVIEEKYLWAGHNTSLMAVYDGSDNLIARFEYGVGRLPVRMTQGSDTYYFAYDQVGSLRAVFTASGALIHEVVYDTYGNILDETTAQGYEALCVPLGFAGGLHDRDTGLVLFGYRDYDPETGTWMTPDPIGFAGGDTYLYAYCAGDPVSWVDIDGLAHMYIGTTLGHGYIIIDNNMDGYGTLYDFGPARGGDSVGAQALNFLQSLFATQGEVRIKGGQRPGAATVKLKISMEAADQIDQYWRKLQMHSRRGFVFYSPIVNNCWMPIFKSLYIAFPPIQAPPITQLDDIYRSNATHLL